MEAQADLAALKDVMGAEVVVVRRRRHGSKRALEPREVKLVLEMQVAIAQQ